MNEDSVWIDILKEIPEFDKDVELKVWYDNFSRWLTIIGQLKFRNSQYGFYKNGELILNVTNWRKIPEKRPDFSNLKFRDFLMIDVCIHKDLDIQIEKFSGFFVDIKDGYLYICLRGCYFNDMIAINLSQIKKITRINVENKTFEEI
ncbi:MAG: hypothetical protein ACTHME_05100 [Candidatus Nitrosocosmicus sp.]